MIGERVAHFEITAKLGEGGMGEVYRAVDTRLKRDVALKILPERLASDPVRLERFRREAEAVARLNHPSVVTLHAVEEAGDLHCLVMELVDGESLDRTLARGPLPLPEALRVAGEIADALAAAHREGIVHRDLKPANVMLTADRRVKVLDFGLAKLAGEETVAGAVTSLPTEPAPLTHEGVAMGTIPYMSPEQARGEPVDHRTDVFSLGCLLYEAASGRRPFAGDSSIDTLHKIVHEEPEPLETLVPGAPLQLQWILRKALAKNPVDRYQSAGDLAVDLRAIRRELEAGGEVVTVETRATEPARPAVRARFRTLAAAVAGTALLGVLALWLFGRPEGAPAPDEAGSLSIRPVTSTGLVTAAAISPDARYVAYVESHQGLQSLHIRQMATAGSLELMPPRPVGYWGVTFTPDGTEIAYGEKSRDDPGGSIFRLAALGGTPRRLVEGIDSAPAYSPDSTRLAWLRAGHPTEVESVLMVAEADGSGARVLATREAPESLAPRFFVTPSWSPDGGVIAASVVSATTDSAWVVAFDASTGEERWASEPYWAWASSVQWLPGGDALLVIGRSTGHANPQIWHLPYPAGEPRQITEGLQWYRITSLSADASALVTVAQTIDATLSIRPPDGSRALRRIPGTRLDGALGFALTDDGRIVYQTAEAGRLELAIMNLDGGGRQLLTEDPYLEGYPRVTPDGRILYSTALGARGELRLAEIDGSGVRTLSPIEHTHPYAALSPDGLWAVVPRATGLWRVPLDGGEPALLTGRPGYLPAVSPDGARVAFFLPAARIGILPSEGGEIERLLDAPAPPASLGTFLRWSDDGEALLVNSAPGDRANIWRLPLDGGEPERLTDFSDELLFWFEPLGDGQSLIVSTGRISRDALLLRNYL